jgi:hypothetical protein
MTKPNEDISKMKYPQLKSFVADWLLNVTDADRPMAERALADLLAAKVYFAQGVDPFAVTLFRSVRTRVSKHFAA